MNPLDKMNDDEFERHASRSCSVSWVRTVLPGSCASIDPAPAITPATVTGGSKAPQFKRSWLR